MDPSERAARSADRAVWWSSAWLIALAIPVLIAVVVFVAVLVIL